MNANYLAKKWVQVALALMVPFTLVCILLYRYYNRPMFADSFGLQEMSLLPAWHVSPEIMSSYAVLTDDELEICAVVYVSRNYRESVGPEIGAGGITLVDVSGGRVIIPRDPHRLYLFAQNGTESIYALQRGDVSQIKSWNQTNVEAKLSSLCASRSEIQSLRMPLATTNR